MKKHFILFLLFFLNTGIAAEKTNFVIEDKFLVLAGLPVINKDYYSLEFGFLTKKKAKNYQYNAYVTATLFEDWLDHPGKVRSGALGFKGGVILPQNNIPLYTMLSVGFAKTALHNNPLFGKEEQSIARKDMLFLEVGALYRIDKIFLRLAYQRGTVKHFKRHVIFSVGVSY